VTVLAAFASGVTGAVLANPASAQAPAHPAGHTASSVTAARQPLPGSLAAGTVRGGRIVLATLSGASHPHARSVARRMMHRRFHWSVRKQYRYLSELWNRESGWNRFAYNPSSGAYGIPQAVPGSKMGSAGKHWRWRARTQIKWGLGYIKGRYRTPHRAWEHEVAYGWY
jgi:hypothetical protein